MAEKMFDGFDHTQYREEVQQRWGKEAYADGDAWWRGMGTERRQPGSSGPGSLGERLDRRRTAGIAAGQRGGPGPGPAARRMAEGHPRDPGGASAP